MWDVVENGNYIPIDEKGGENPRSAWTKDHQTKYLLYSKARNMKPSNNCLDNSKVQNIMNNLRSLSKT